MVGDQSQSWAEVTGIQWHADVTTCLGTCKSLVVVKENQEGGDDEMMNIDEMIDADDDD